MKFGGKEYGAVTGVDMAVDPLMRYFKYTHLPVHLQEISRPFEELARFIERECGTGDIQERHEALRKLLEAKDCAVRSNIFPTE